MPLIEYRDRIVISRSPVRIRVLAVLNANELRRDSALRRKSRYAVALHFCGFAGVLGGYVSARLNAMFLARGIAPQLDWQLAARNRMNTFRGSPIVTLPELAERSLSLLGQIIDQAHERIPDKLDFTSPPEFIYLHARNICDLGGDVLALEAWNRSRGSRILVRSMSESLFNLVAAAKNPEFPASKFIAEQKDEIKRIKMWIGKNPPSEFHDKLEEAERNIHKIEQRYPNRKDREWGAIETAKAAELTVHYRSDYFVFSGNVHSKIGALYACESKINPGIVFDPVVRIILTTLDEFVGALEIDLSQEQIDEKKRLSEAANKLIETAPFEGTP